ncbi:MAG: hypothetical protein KGL18_12265 [Burkholderiales bacterium]|nr:hypothetical protein [Burkholderiales bacterium]MDE1928335.1 hypothetical protein [Burkholderiales bacterium]MDE2503730.1 hypothetical protein [Burkholderiales bacterium]
MGTDPERAAAPRIVMLHPAAPTKPAEGAPCNGCGLCCAAAPCPLGMFASRRRHGRCAALTWDESGARHRCGVVVDPGRWLPWLPRPWARHLARRWIAAGSGCDSDLIAG